VSPVARAGGAGSAAEAAEPAGSATEAAEQSVPPGRRGRRPGNEDTRGAIVAAARVEFVARGYAATTLRGIARAASVDPRLVHHYFDSKRDVFAATIGVPADLSAIVAAVAGPGPDGVGERLVGAFTGVWDAPGMRERMVMLLSAALSDPPTARMVREFVTFEIFGAITSALGVPDGELRASLALSQMLGLAMARYVLVIEPVSSLPPSQVVAMVGPTLQRYLADPL
jgi:AcrR family transcriptional regulator